MPPTARAFRVDRHEFGRAGDRQLIGGEAHGRRRRHGRLFEQGPEEAQRAKLDRNAEAVVVAAVLGHERAIGVVEVEMASELVRCGFAGEPAVLAGLAVGKETDRHRSGLLRPRGGPRRPFAEEFRRRFPWLACGVDVCIERR